MKHSKSLRFVSVLYIFLGLILLVGSVTLFSRHLLFGSLFSLFLAFVHFFVAWGIWHHKKWAPYLGILFELYLLFNFLMYSIPLFRERITLVAPISYGMLVFASFVPILLVISCIVSILVLKREHFIH